MQKTKILIIEDEALVAITLKRGLQRAGYEVCGVAATGEEAVEIARKEAPHVMIVDIHLMGEVDGLEAARQIKTFSSANLIFTTGYQDADLKASALALHPLAYLLKPVEAPMIDRLLRAHHIGGSYVNVCSPSC